MAAFENALLGVSERVISLMISNTILISCVRIINSDFCFVSCSHSFHFKALKMCYLKVKTTRI